MFIATFITLDVVGRCPHKKSWDHDEKWDVQKELIIADSTRLFSNLNI
jgi:hypothetical protein